MRNGYTVPSLPFVCLQSAAPVWPTVAAFCILCPLLRLIQDRGPGIIMTQTLVSTACLLNSPSNLCSHTVSVILL